MFYHMHIGWEKLHIFGHLQSDRYWVVELLLVFVVDATSITVDSVEMGTKVVSRRRQPERGRMLTMSTEDTRNSDHTSGPDYSCRNIHDNGISNDITRHPRFHIDPRAWDSHPEIQPPDSRVDSADAYICVC